MYISSLYRIFVEDSLRVKLEIPSIAIGGKYLICCFLMGLFSCLVTILQTSLVAGIASRYGRYVCRPRC